jgi:site-specific DNA recombinase
LATGYPEGFSPCSPSMPSPTVTSVSTLLVIKRLRDAGVRIVSYLDGRDVTLDDEQGELNAFLQSMLASGERRKAAQRSTDKYCQQAHARYVTGGRTFNYDNHRTNGHVDRVVNEREAAVVRTIFEQFATGAGLKKIAQTLNQQGAATPRPSKSGAAGWSPSTLKALLDRELYAGVLVTNKLKKRDKHGRHRVTKRPAAEWIRVEQRHWQIIPSALWTKVQRRLAENAAAYLRSADGRLRGRPVGSAPYLSYVLSGLGTCATCGGSMAVRTSGGLPRRAWLECLTFRTKGQASCANRLRVALSVAEQAILTKMQTDLLRPEVIVAAIHKVIATLTPDPAVLETERARLRNQITNTERQLANLGAAVAAGGSLPTLLESINREADLAGLRATPRDVDQRQALTQMDPAALDARLRGKLREFTNLAGRHPAAARSLLKKVISGRLRFTPVIAPDRAFYRVEWLGTHAGLLAKELEAVVPHVHDSASFIGGDPGGIRTRVHGPPCAFLTVKGHSTALTKRDDPGT